MMFRSGIGWSKWRASVISRKRSSFGKQEETFVEIGSNLKLAPFQWCEWVAWLTMGGVSVKKKTGNPAISSTRRYVLNCMVQLGKAMFVVRNLEELESIKGNASAA